MLLHGPTFAFIPIINGAILSSASTGTGAVTLTAVTLTGTGYNPATAVNWLKDLSANSWIQDDQGEDW